MGTLICVTRKMRIWVTGIGNHKQKNVIALNGSGTLKKIGTGNGIYKIVTVLTSLQF